MTKTYKCTNYGICPEADRGTVFQETDLEEVDGKFVCPKCGQELEEMVGKPPVRRWLIVAAAVLVLGGGGAAVWFGLGKDGEGTETVASPEPTVIFWSAAEAAAELGKESPLPTVSVSPEGLPLTFSSSDERVASVSAAGKVTPLGEGTATITAAFAGSPEQTAAAATYTLVVKKKRIPTSYRLSWGVYDGPMENGRPHGIQGVVNVTSRYTIDLKNGRGECRNVQPGDRIVNCKFVNGRLVYGIIKYSSGEQEILNIGI
ncbi:MAG: Ig-like domain-containing protein [Bacteroidales bacterium]|nr:Ig-like domain-containing protein [Bacteroidales bacterium]